jgi:hypothetical protein
MGSISNNTIHEKFNFFLMQLHLRRVKKTIMRWRNNYPILLQLEDFFRQDAAQKRILMQTSPPSCKYLQTEFTKQGYFRLTPAKKRRPKNLNKLKIKSV